MTELERLAEGIKRADEAGDAEAVRLLGARYRELQGSRVLGDRSMEELSQLDPATAEHGGVKREPFGPVELLAAGVGTGAVQAGGRALAAGARAVAPVAKKAGAGLAFGGGGYGGFELLRRLFGEQR